MATAIAWKLLHPRMTMDHLGYIPRFIDMDDPRPAAVQINENYISGWTPMVRWEFTAGPNVIRYPNDPPLLPLATAELRGEKLFYYQGSWVCIVQPEGQFEVARLD
jgi:hypothetical protein